MLLDLPVWTIRPNWKGGVLERLEWLTDVLTSSTGVEQRRSLRRTPRRTIEITVNPTQRERTFLDLLLQRLGSSSWYFPLWFDQGRVDAPVALGANRVTFDNTFRDFVTGGYAILYIDAFTWETVAIQGQDDDGLTLTAVTENAWPAGTKVYPLRRCIIAGETKIDAVTSQVGESVLAFQVNEANAWPAVMPDDLVYMGMPVMTVEPNRVQTITTQHTRLAVDRDGQLGRVERKDTANRAFGVQGHNWMLVGREAQASFRSMLYWLRGRQRAVWLPTFNDDVVVTRPSIAGSTNLDIAKIGYSYVGFPVAGRDTLWLAGDPAKITALGAPQGVNEERLRVGAGLLNAVAPGASGSFMDAARMDTDTVELHHHADSDGAMEASATFRAFSNVRVDGGVINVPIPESGKFYGTCGSAFELLNPNFEQGAVGWMGEFAVKDSNSNGGAPVDGSLVGWSGNVPEGQFYQDLTIPTRYWAAIDQGRVQLSGFSGYHCTYVSQTDHGHLFCAFKNEYNVETGRITTPNDESKTWVLMTLPPAMIPPGTRVLRFGTHNYRDQGSECNSDWDAMSPGILTVLDN